MKKLLVVLLFTIHCSLTPVYADMRAVVRIIGITQEFQSVKQSDGHGAFVGPDIILSSKHILEGVTDIANGLKIITKDKVCKGNIIYQDTTLDLMIIQADCKNEVYLQAGEVNVGDRVSMPVLYQAFTEKYGSNQKGAIKAPLLLRGYVAGKTDKYLLVDIKAKAGFSGAAVLNEKGEIIGVLSMDVADGFMAVVTPIGLIKDKLNILNR